MEINLWIITLILKYIDYNQVKIIDVRHIEGLHIPVILAFTSRHWDINSYLPEYECEKYLSRKWIWNVDMLDDYAIWIVNSLIHNKFKDFVNGKITEINNRIDHKKGSRSSVLPSWRKCSQTQILYHVINEHNCE